MRNPVIRVTKKFSFEMAHALWNYDGHCRSIHGHTYGMYVTVKGKPLTDTDDPKYGMVIDFGVLKKLVHEQIIDIFDHAVVLSKDADHEQLPNVRQMFDRIQIVDYQPTCELLVHDYAQRLLKVLPPQIELVSLRLVETETSYAEWHLEDNK